MTGRTIAVLALMSVVVATVAVVVHPFLHHVDTARRPAVDRPSPVVHGNREVMAVATVAANDALACDPPSHRQSEASPARRDSCGRLTLTRSQVGCTSATSCRVDLIGSLATASVTAIIALTVNMQRGPNRWIAVAVSS
jgi:hypothetical protein